MESQLKYWANLNLPTPPSLKEVASHIGCDKRLLYSKGYELSKQKSQKYTTYINTRAKERIEIEKNGVDAIKELNQQGVYPSRRKVEEFLGIPGIIREKIVRDKWNEEFKKLLG